MASESGFEIEGRVYPFPMAYRMGDTVLVPEVSGLSFAEYADMLDEGGLSDPRVLLAMVAVAVSQGNPQWRRDRVVKYVLELSHDGLEFVAPDEPEEEPEGDAVPPAEGSADGSQSSPPTSSRSQGSPSGATLRSIGAPGLATGSQG